MNRALHYGTKGRQNLLGSVLLNYAVVRRSYQNIAQLFQYLEVVNRCLIVTTLQQLKQFVYWPNMRKSVSKFLASCMQCIKDRCGNIIPRPQGRQLQAEACIQ